MWTYLLEFWTRTMTGSVHKRTIFIKKKNQCQLCHPSPMKRALGTKSITLKGKFAKSSLHCSNHCTIIIESICQLTAGYRFPLKDGHASLSDATCFHCSPVNSLMSSNNLNYPKWDTKNIVLSLLRHPIRTRKIFEN